MLTKYIKSALWGVAVRLSYIQDTWYIKVEETSKRLTAVTNCIVGRRSSAACVRITLCGSVR